jgi:hypothetical protein
MDGVPCAGERAYGVEIAAENIHSLYTLFCMLETPWQFNPGSKLHTRCENFETRFKHVKLEWKLNETVEFSHVGFIV